MKWPTAPLGDLCNVISGGTPKRFVDEYWNGDIAWVKISDMLQGEITSTDEYITELGLRESPARLLAPGTLLLSIFATIGRTAILTIPAATNQAIVGLQLKSDTLNQAYLRYFLDSQAAALKQKSRGVAQDNINSSILKQLQIPLPPLEEQRRIAAILDNAQDVKTLCDKAEKLSEIADRSLFLYYFGEQPASNEITLEGIAGRRANAIRTGPFGSQLLHSEFTETGIAVLGIDNAVTNDFTWGKRRYISEEKYRQLARYTVFPGDLLITIMGTCGRVAVVPDDIPTAINTKHLCAITVNQAVILPDYLHDYILYHPFAAKHLARQTKGAIMAGLNMSIIKQMPILLPPLETQLNWHSRRKLAKTIVSKNRAKHGSISLLASSLNQILLNGSSS